ncbi:phosphatidylserine decarboxylase-domain-containing protein [Flagelloscypha sp. PMI_526]|nr:phosphatidylserine decarboxylase-domain-containing protein [Flagelloscypha sp. PMI_526]
MPTCAPSSKGLSGAVRRIFRHHRDPTIPPELVEVESSADKPVHTLDSAKTCVEDDPLGNLPEVDHERLAEALKSLVDHSATHTDLGQGIYASTQNLWSLPWIDKLIPGIEKVASEYHMGNFVIERETGEKKFEFMPLYTRIGMHLLFYGKLQEKVLDMDWLQNILKDLSIRQGQIYDNPASVSGIASFVATYDLPLDDLLEPDVTKYKCFNEFFYRLVFFSIYARPIQKADDPTVLTCLADCRLVVYSSIELSHKFWVKGNEFDIPHLLNVPSSVAKKFTKHGPPSVAIFRLAPQDYHRFHSPVDATIGEITKIPGEYYTVNPMVVNQDDLDVFTANTREVLYMTHTQTGLPVAYVAVGALLVGSVRWTGGAKKGEQVKRGDEIGYFAYGGSTIVALFAKGIVEFDEDLLKNSEKPIETLVRVGMTLGKTPSQPTKFLGLF